MNGNMEYFLLNNLYFSQAKKCFSLKIKTIRTSFIKS